MLKLNSSGNAVAEVQKNLIKLGFPCGPSGADGKFGSYTDAAVRKFQKAYGLITDGKVGPQTLNKISELLKAKAKANPASPAKPVPKVTPKITEPNMNQLLDMSGANPKNLITIVNTTFNPPRAINFFGLAPDDISESHSANFDPIEINGRSNPLAVYSGSGARTVDLNVDVHEDYLKMYDKKLKNATIIEFVSQVKALTYPRYQNGVVIPPKVFIKIGQFFRMKAYCNSVSVTWKKPIRNGKYIVAGLSMNFSEILSISFSADEIATGKDLGRYFNYPG